MTLHLFEGYGIEIEYMIVDEETLAVRPIADELLRAAAGETVLEVERGDLAWSNELALHVVELKTNGPASSLEPLPAAFDADLAEVEALLAPQGARLLPGGMHPFMDPNTDFRLWPHEANVIYETFNRIFDCRGHGWSNLQSMHINLPFGDDDEFGRLHAAIRLVLPLLPALAASTPIVEGRAAGALDHRLLVYRDNARRVPSVSGAVVPEAVFSEAAYQQLLERIYTDLEPHDAEGTLRNEWVNSRGAIARFDRSAIEIRLIDAQEAPRADLSVAALVIAVVRALVEERLSETAAQRRLDERRLASLLWTCAEAGDAAVLDDTEYLALLGCSERRLTARELWQALVEKVAPATAAGQGPWASWWAHYQRRGCLSRRLLDAVGSEPWSRGALVEVYRELATCLREGRFFG